MAKIKLSVSATIEDTFKDFIVSRKAKGLAEKTVQSYTSQFYAVARHLDVKMDIALLQKADLDAMIISMRDAGLSSNSINSYTRTLKSFFSWCNKESITRIDIGLYKAEETISQQQTRRTGNVQNECPALSQGKAALIHAQRRCFFRGISPECPPECLRWQ